MRNQNYINGIDGIDGNKFILLVKENKLMGEMKKYIGKDEDTLNELLQGFINEIMNINIKNIKFP